VRIPIRLKGIPYGVKTEGGMLSQETQYLKLKSPVNSIPSVLELDISPAKAGSTFYAEAIPLDEGVSLSSKKRTVIYTISKSRIKEAE
jgi:large subunit ribosomal protein L25